MISIKEGREHVRIQMVNNDVQIASGFYGQYYFMHRFRDAYESSSTINITTTSYVLPVVKEEVTDCLKHGITLTSP